MGVEGMGTAHAWLYPDAWPCTLHMRNEAMRCEGHIQKHIQYRVGILIDCSTWAAYGLDVDCIFFFNLFP